ncbi:sodium:solute symporter family protein [Verrucomicrobiales bacterium]|nr:sodium:solute symporter family protein [Verrucomicrobiales bacterium]
MIILANSPTGYALGNGGLAFISLYILTLIGIGWLGHRAKKEDSLEDHYLGGRAFGFSVLFLTLYATQYSGNSFMGFVGKAYRDGFPVFSTVVAMMAVIGGYFIYAPRLYRLSIRKKYVTLGDYIQDRFSFRPLTILLVLIGIFGLGNYVLTNLLALGKLAEVVSGNRIDFNYAVIALAVVMLIYETMGGMRSVAWTDVTQGVILLISLGFIAFALFFHLGGPSGVAEGLESVRPDIWEPPSLKQKITWLSSVLLFFFGISMYPHAVQRIYAARDEKTLRRSLQVMAFMPLVTTFFLVLLGVMAISVFPDLQKSESDRTTLLMVGKLMEELPALVMMGPLLVAAVIAATMSTIDSALLAISSMVTNDIYRVKYPNSNNKTLTMIGKMTSIIVMACVVLLTILLQDQTIWRLLEIKLEVLAQIAPAVMLGTQIKRIGALPFFIGALFGTILAVYLTMAPDSKPLGVHAGIWGLGLNIMLVFIVHIFSNVRRTGSPSVAK